MSVVKLEPNQTEQMDAILLLPCDYWCNWGNGCEMHHGENWGGGVCDDNDAFARNNEYIYYFTLVHF